MTAADLATELELVANGHPEARDRIAAAFATLLAERDQARAVANGDYYHRPGDRPQWLRHEHARRDVNKRGRCRCGADWIDKYDGRGLSTHGCAREECSAGSRHISWSDLAQALQWACEFALEEFDKAGDRQSASVMRRALAGEKLG